MSAERESTPPDESAEQGRDQFDAGPIAPNPLSNLGPPPRHVPLSVRLGFLFGGMLNQMGWFFFGLGMIFYWVLATYADFDSIYFWGDVETVAGKVTSRDETSFTVNKKKVYKIGYEYAAAGVKRTGVSYTKDGARGPGDAVRIEHPAGKPEISRIEGGRGRPIPLPVLLVAVFPLVGFLCVAYGFRRGRTAIHLFRAGATSVATLVDRERTNTKINKRPVYKFTYEFPAADGNVYKAIAKTHATEKLAGRDQPLLYDAENPGDAMLVNHLACRPEVDELGQIAPRPTKGILAAMVLPTLSIVGHGTVVIWRALAAV